MEVTDCVIQEIVDELEASSNYRARREAVREFNAKSPILKKGIALTPVKFGISFTAIHLNQAGALVHVYKDGSVHLNHGGTEMGQGLFIKVAQVVAEEFQIDIERVKITATSTAKVPNTSPTAASSGSDINGMAARNAAAATIKQRLIAFAASKYKSAGGAGPVPAQSRADRKRGDELRRTWCWRPISARISLSSTGFYRTPEYLLRPRERARHSFLLLRLRRGRERGRDRHADRREPLLAVDILHDVGKSLNPAIDLGQIEGGFIQGRRLAHHGGALVEREGAADDARALHLQDPDRQRSPGRN